MPVLRDALGSGLASGGGIEGLLAQLQAQLSPGGGGGSVSAPPTPPISSGPGPRPVSPPTPPPVAAPPTPPTIPVPGGGMTDPQKPAPTTDRPPQKPGWIDTTTKPTDPQTGGSTPGPAAPNPQVKPVAPPPPKMTPSGLTEDEVAKLPTELQALAQNPSARGYLKRFVSQGQTLAAPPSPPTTQPAPAPAPQPAPQPAPPAGAGGDQVSTYNEGYDTRRFVANWGPPGQPIQTPDGGSITIPETGLTQAEYDVLSGVTHGNPIGGPTAQAILDRLIRAGVYVPRGTTGAPAPGANAVPQIKPGQVTL